MNVVAPSDDVETLPELRAVLELCCGKAELISHAEQPWASLRFNGKRHTISLRFVGIDNIAMAEAVIGGLPEHEFSLAGKICADAHIIWVERRTGVKDTPPETTVTLELLILEDE